MNTTNITNALIAGIPAGGATINQDGQPVKLGIAVAVGPEYEHTVAAGRDFDQWHEVDDWLRENKELASKFPAFCFGLWVDDQGAVVLDLVEVLPADQIVLAVLKGQQRKQKAIQLLHPCVTLWLEQPGV